MIGKIGSEEYAEAEDTLPFFAEAVESTLQSASVFAIAALRALAWKGTLSKEDSEELLALPMDGAQLRRLKDKHIKYWRKMKDRDILDNADEYTNANQRTATLVVDHVGDENSSRECVHYVGHDESRKIIICVFRGSVTLSDWMEDAKILLERVPNPLKHVDGQPETVGIHQGFRNYIYGINDTTNNLLSKVIASVGESMRGPDQVDGCARPSRHSRMELLLDQLRERKRKFPTFSIYVQGHSLGGALALIACLEIASDPVLSHTPSNAPIRSAPVTCIAVGNPKPGDGDFCRAVEYLEGIRKLRCCVIHNAYDIVPMLATNLARLDSGFWHPGWRLLLYKSRSEWGRGRGSIKNLPGIYCDDHTESTSKVGCCSFPRGKWKEDDSRSMWNVPADFDPIAAAKKMTKYRLNIHDHREYLRRLLDQAEQLQRIRLDDLYENLWAEDEESRAKHDPLGAQEVVVNNVANI